MRKLRMIVALALVMSLLSSASALAGKPEPEITFSVAGTTFEGGSPVDMSGRVQPVTPGERVRLETQVFKKRTSEWVAYDIKRTRTNRRGRFSYTHEAFPAGKRYRTRALVRETEQHLAGKTVWDVFKVERRAHG